MVIVDSTVWIDYFNGLQNPETDWLEAQLDRQRLGLTAVNLCEVLQGIRDERTAAKVQACIEEQHSLLHRDCDFDPFEELLGLSVVHP